jgi:hypothetical protein
MAVATVALPPQDELLRLTGTSGDPFEDISVTGAGVGRYYGDSATTDQYLVCAGTAGSTLDVKFQDSADNVTYADMGIAFSQQTASGAVATGSLAAFPKRTVTMQDGRPWLRVHKTTSGTWVDVAVLHEMAKSF